MYRTEDNYYLEHKSNITDFDSLYSKISKKHDIDWVFKLKDVKALLCGEVYISNTYEAYKKFLYVLYSLIGEYEIEILFAADLPELGFQPTTKVSFVVDKNGGARFELVNEIEPEEGLQKGSEAFINYEKALKDNYIMFESDNTVEVDMRGLSLKDFLKSIQPPRTKQSSILR